MRAAFGVGGLVAMVAAPVHICISLQKGGEGRGWKDVEIQSVPG